MSLPAPFRRRLPPGRLIALALVALLHAGFVAVLTLPIVTAPSRPLPEAHETVLTLLSAMAPPQVLRKKQRTRTGASGEASAIGPYFNPYTAHLPAGALPGPDRLTFALSACAPEKVEMASMEVRQACGRIGALVALDPGHFGFTSEVQDNRHWQVELARREAPYLAPCMTPSGPDVLYALVCVYDLLFKGYDPEKRARYSQ